jgi:hypothetical protein
MERHYPDKNRGLSFQLRNGANGRERLLHWILHRHCTVFCTASGRPAEVILRHLTVVLASYLVAITDPRAKDV